MNRPSLLRHRRAQVSTYVQLEHSKPGRSLTTSITLSYLQVTAFIGDFPLDFPVPCCVAIAPHSRNNNNPQTAGQTLCVSSYAVSNFAALPRDSELRHACYTTS